MEQNAKRIGRPPSDNPHSDMLHVRITPDMSEWIDRISEERLDRPTQAQIVREALAEFIERWRKA